jgi:hypothetical protein
LVGTRGVSVLRRAVLTASYLLSAGLLFACGILPADPTPTIMPSPPDRTLHLTSTPTATATTTARSECRESTEPAGEDIDYALSFGAPILDSSEWQQSHEVQDDRVRVTWTNQEGGLIFLEVLIFFCGYSSDVIDQYFSMQNFEQIFYADYQDVIVTANCMNDSESVRLYEIAASWEEQAYAIRHWALTDHPTRVLSILAAFPKDSDDQLDQYSEYLFPQLISCQD